ncbi:4Fe-4S binding protein [Lacrimispora sp.]
MQGRRGGCDEAPSQTDEDTCISCMRCITVCPVGA